MFISLSFISSRLIQSYINITAKRAFLIAINRSETHRAGLSRSGLAHGSDLCVITSYIGGVHHDFLIPSSECWNKT